VNGESYGKSREEGGILNKLFPTFIRLNEPKNNANGVSIYAKTASISYISDQKLMRKKALV